jgi:hypothetical protein
MYAGVVGPADTYCLVATEGSSASEGGVHTSAVWLVSLPEVWLIPLFVSPMASQAMYILTTLET